MLYRYDKKKLIFVSVKNRLISFIYVIVITNILSFSCGRYLNSPELDVFEKELILLTIEDTTYNFTKENLILELKRLNIKFPHIVMAQSMRIIIYLE